MSNLSCGTHVAEPSANKDCRKLLNQFCRFLPKLKLPISADAKLPLTHLNPQQWLTYVLNNIKTTPEDQLPNLLPQNFDKSLLKLV